MPFESNLNIAIVGATGVVGRELLAALAETGHGADRVTVLGSERAVGTEVEFGGETLEVERATPEALRGMKLVFLAVPPEVVRVLAPAAQANGAFVVDASQTFADELQVPVVVPAVNGGVLLKPFPGRIVRCPTATAAALATVLAPLKAPYGISQVQVTALMGSSSEGTRGVSELEQQTVNLLAARELEPGRFPHRLAFNLIPQVGAFVGASTVEELGWRRDVSRVLELPSLVLDGTAVQVPTFFGHALSLTVKLARGAEVDAVRDALRTSSAIKILDAPAEKIYPLPSTVTADPTLHVGRVRAFAGSLDTFQIYAVVDNAGRGAALNLLEVGEQLSMRA